MTTVNPYLVFKGACEDAFEFYKSIFGGEFPYKGRYKDAPQTDKHLFPQWADEKIMHISLPISKETMLMGCDSIEGMEKPPATDHQFSLSITTDTQQEADRLFQALSAEGVVKMPMTKTFWGSYFGMLKDKFGINWMISFAINQ